MSLPLEVEHVRRHLSNVGDDHLMTNSVTNSPSGPVYSHQWHWLTRNSGMIQEWCFPLFFRGWKSGLDETLGTSEILLNFGIRTKIASIGGDQKVEAEKSNSTKITPTVFRCLLGHLSAWPSTFSRVEAFESETCEIYCQGNNVSWLRGVYMYLFRSFSFPNTKDPEKSGYWFSEWFCGDGPGGTVESEVFAIRNFSSLKHALRYIHPISLVLEGWHFVKVFDPCVFHVWQQKGTKFSSWDLWGKSLSKQIHTITIARDAGENAHVFPSDLELSVFKD